MRVSAVEELIVNKKSKIYGWRTFRLEYGGHAEDCIVEGRIYIPPDRLDKCREIIDQIEDLLTGVNSD